MRRMVLFYPLVVAAFPVIFLASQNRDEIFILQVASILAVVLVAALVLTLLLRLFIKDSAKVAAIISVILVIFFSYGHIHELTRPITVSAVPILGHPFLVTVMAVIAIGSIWGILRFKGNLRLPMHYIAGATLLLVLINLGSIGLHTATASESEAENNRSKSVNLIPESRQRPDIYYIIFDGYARSDVLRTVHKFDNSEILNFLESRGFYIGTESRSNYTETRLSLASSLNMRYLDGKDRGNLGPLYENNEALKFTRSIGYKIVHFDSIWRWTAQNPNADVEISRATSLWEGKDSALLNEFSETLLLSTAAKLLNLERFYSESAAEVFHYSVETLRDIPKMPEPTFTFVHFTPPHPPYMFDQHGQLLSESRYPNRTKWDWHIKDLYVDELIYLNKTMKEIVDDILTQSATEPIIIIQGDHGSKASAKPRDLVIFERTSILNAYYLPEYCRSGLYPSISPVNSFRVVFDSCFGADFELLEDKTYFVEESDSIQDTSPEQSQARCETMVGDSSGNDNNGTMVNAPTRVEGKFGGALSFDGSDDHVSAGDIHKFEGTAPFTISLWAKDDGASGSYDRLLSKETLGDIREGWLFFRDKTQEKYAFDRRGRSGADHGTDHIEFPYESGEWNHVAITYDGVHLRGYLNGALAAGPIVSSRSIAPTFYPLTIGVRSDARNSFFQGLVDDVRIYERALSEAEMTELFQGSTDELAPSPDAGLVSHWKFDQESDTAGSECPP